MKYFLLILGLTFLLSCDSGTDMMVSVSGKAGELIVIMDKPFKDGDCGDVLLSYFRQVYPQLPQEEPLFDVSVIPSDNFGSFIKTHRSILVCKIGPDADATAGIKTGENVWATPQLYMEINAKDAASFIALVEKHHQTIIDYFMKGEQNRLTENYRSYSDKIITQRLQQKYGFDIAIPKGYKLDVDKPEFTWITNETQHTSQGVLIYMLPGEMNQQTDIMAFLTRHDSILKVNVPASVPDSWMTTEREVPVTRDSVSIGGMQFTEIRGLWRAENDFMGGPFIINYTYLPEKQSTFVMMGYVYAPRFDKRTYLQQVEAILYSVQEAGKK